MQVSLDKNLVSKSVTGLCNIISFIDELGEDKADSSEIQLDNLEIINFSSKSYGLSVACVNIDGIKRYNWIKAEIAYVSPL